MPQMPTADDRVGHTHIECLLAPAQHVQAHARDHRRQPPIEVLDRTGVGAMRALQKLAATTRQIAGEWVERLVTREPAEQAA